MDQVPAVTTCAAHFLNGPCQASRTGVALRVDVVAVKAKSGLKPQAVARAKTDGRDLFHCEQGFAEGLSSRLGHRDFIPVLAGVTRA